MKLILKPILFAVVLFSLVHTITAQADKEEITIETSLVVVPVEVTDRNDKSIADLKKEDFRVFEDGAEQEIAGFENSFAPFTIALALDISESTEEQMNSMKRAAVAFFKQIRPEDRLIVYTFHNYLNKIADVKNASLTDAEKSITLSAPGGKSAVYDAVGKIIGDDLRKVTGKKALIIFTDGVDTDSENEGLESSLRTAQESGVLIFPIQYNTQAEIRKKFPQDAQLFTSKNEPLSEAYPRATRYLNMLSNNSGGEMFFSDSVENLEKNFTKIAKQLSQIYSLSYYQPNDESQKKHKIKVEVKNSQAVVRARKTSYQIKEKIKEKTKKK